MRSSSPPWLYLFFGALLGALINVPFYAWIFARNWDWANGFPVGWLGAGMTYMATFFHEIGHTIFMWFYGYPTIPIFDFTHGGGFAVAMTGQQYLIMGCVYVFLIYVIASDKLPMWARVTAGLVGLFHVATAFSDAHEVVYTFMGPAAEALVGGFLIYRCLFDLAPRGGFERLLNGVFGFGLIFKIFIDSYGLIKSDAYRLVYYEQKGSHGFGDFDKIASYLPGISFEVVVYVWAGIGLLCLCLPFVFYFISRDETV